MSTGNLHALAALVGRERDTLLARWHDEVRQRAVAPALDVPTLNNHVIDAHHFAVEEEEGRERLVLRRGCDVLFVGRVRQVLAGRFGAHLRGVALAAGEDEPPDGLAVSLLGADAIMLQPDMLADPLR